MVVETVGYNPKARRVTDALTGYGVRAGSQLNRVENIAELIDDDENYVGGEPIRVRGQDLAVEAPAGEYFAEVVRELVPEHRDLLLADESELRALVPPDLPEILRLEAWHHPDVLVERPSREETFQLIAKVLDTGNPHEYRPTQAPNTHWSNWPESGNAYVSGLPLEAHARRGRLNTPKDAPDRHGYRPVQRARPQRRALPAGGHHRVSVAGEARRPLDDPAADRQVALHQTLGLRGEVKRARSGVQDRRAQRQPAHLHPGDDQHGGGAGRGLAGVRVLRQLAVQTGGAQIMGHRLEGLQQGHVHPAQRKRRTSKCTDPLHVQNRALLRPGPRPDPIRGQCTVSVMSGSEYSSVIASSPDVVRGGVVADQQLSEKVHVIAARADEPRGGGGVAALGDLKRGCEPEGLWRNIARGGPPAPAGAPEIRGVQVCAHVGYRRLVPALGRPPRSV